MKHTIFFFLNRMQVCQLNQYILYSKPFYAYAVLSTVGWLRVVSEAGQPGLLLKDPLGCIKGEKC